MSTRARSTKIEPRTSLKLIKESVKVLRLKSSVRTGLAKAAGGSNSGGPVDGGGA